MLGLREEAVSFLTAVLAGMIVTCGYLCLRRLRRVIPHSLAVIAIEDALFWLCTAVYLFVQIYHTSSGSIRWYFVVGTIAGMSVMLILDVIWRKRLSEFWKKHFGKKHKKK